MKYNAGIDGIRALAVMLVIIYHFWPSALNSGYIGVDIFFVISGFVITKTVKSDISLDRFSLLSFYRRRINRLYPGLIVVLAMITLAGACLLIKTERLELYKELLASALFVPNIYFYFNTNYFAIEDTYKPLLNMWSLGVEEQFYLFWPFLMLVLKKRKPIAVTGVGICALSLASWLVLSPSNPTLAFYMPFTRIWELVAGAVLAMVELEKLGEKASSLLSLNGSLALVISYALLSTGLANFPGPAAILVIAGTALLLLSTFGNSPISTVLGNPVVVRVGKLSYLLYLFHWPILYFFNLLALPQPMKFPVLAVVFLLSALTFHLFEQPIRKANTLKTAGVLATISLAFGFFSSIEIMFLRGSDPTVVSAAHNQFTFTYRGSCAAVATTEGDDFCSTNSIFEKSSVVMIGDSFAGAYSNLLKYLSRENLFTYFVAARGQCPPAVAVGPAECVQFNENMLEKLVASKTAETVILAADWSRYIDGGSTWEKQFPDTSKYFQDRLRQTIEALQRAHKNVVLFYSPPDGADPRSCVDRSSDTGDAKHDAECNIPIDEKFRMYNHYRDSMRWIESSGIKIYDPVPDMCDAKECKVAEPPYIFYVDHGHLSEFGAYYLFRRSKNVLLPMLLKKHN